MIGDPNILSLFICIILLILFSLMFNVIKRFIHINRINTRIENMITSMISEYPIL